MTKWYGIPQVTRDKTKLHGIPRMRASDRNVQSFYDAVTERLETLTGERGQAIDKAVTWRDLKDQGIIRDDQRRSGNYNLTVDPDFCLASIEALEVADIALPDIAFKVPNNNEQGHFLVVYQEGDPEQDIFTLYVWDWNYAGAENVPYVVHAEQSKNGKLFSGAWIAIGGRYINGDLSVSGAITSSNLQVVEVADIANPTELSGLTVENDGSIAIAYQVVAAGPDLVTVYIYDSDAGADSSPYVVSGWIAAAGTYQNGNRNINGILTVSDRIVGGMGAKSTGGVTDWDDITNARSGNGYSLLLGSATNGPGPGYHFHSFTFEYGTKNGSGNMTQMAIPYSTSSLPYGIYIRSRFSGTWTSWRRIPIEDASGYTPSTSGYKVGSSIVVNSRKAAVAVIPHAAGAAPTAAEFDALVDAFNDLVVKLSSASGHGLIT